MKESRSVGEGNSVDVASHLRYGGVQGVGDNERRGRYIDSGVDIIAGCSSLTDLLLQQILDQDPWLCQGDPYAQSILDAAHSSIASRRLGSPKRRIPRLGFSACIIRYVSSR